MKRVWKSWSEHDNIVLLGHDPFNINRLAIISFLIKVDDRYLHWNFVSSLLNDLFGIQVRGGCVCAGPYAIELLGIQNQVDDFERELLEKDELVRPGNLYLYKFE